MNPENTNDDVHYAYANPMYDDIILFLDTLPSSQDKLKPIDISNGIFKLYEKHNVTEFKKMLQARLEAKRKSSWPYSNDLFMSIKITGTKNEIYEKDLDNLLKTLFDTLKGIVYIDDKQITKLCAEKKITAVPEAKGVIVALKHILLTEEITLSPLLYSVNEDIWKEERKKKGKQGKHTYFDGY